MNEIKFLGWAKLDLSHMELSIDLEVGKHEFKDLTVELTPTQIKIFLQQIISQLETIKEEVE